jgi:uncharacterized protein
MIGIFSDIHDNIFNLGKAFKVFKKNKVKQVFFCGDLVSPFTTDYFKHLKIPVKAVFGNNEGDKVNILKRIRRNKIDFSYAPKQGLFWDLKIKKLKVAVFHGHQQEITNLAVNCQSYDLVLTGHTHFPHIKKINKTLWINPGSLCGWAGSDIKPIKPSVAVFNLKPLQGKIIIL